MEKLPEGCELTLSVYCRSDNEDLDVVLSLSGMKVFLTAPIDPASFLKSLPDFTDDWRLMTSAEIVEYKAREEED